MINIVSIKLLACVNATNVLQHICCLSSSKLHVFRAVEPALKHRYKHFNCGTSSPPKLYQQCLERRSEGLATRAQLAKLIFEHQEKESKTMQDQAQSL